MQLTENLEYCSKYLESYSENELLKEYKFKVSFELIRDYQNLIQNLLNKDPKEKKDWLKKEKECLITLCKNIRANLKDNLFVEYIDNIISFIICQHSLTEHIEDIKLVTRLIISDFLLDGFSVQDIEFIFEFIGKYPNFSIGDSDFFNHQLRFKNDILKKFKESKTLNDQIKMIIDLRLKPIVLNYYFFKIYGLQFESNFVEEFGSLTLISPKNEKFNKLKATGSEIVLNYFKCDNEFSFAQIKCEFKSADLAQTSALEELKNFVIKLNFQTNTTFIFDQSNILVTSDFETINYLRYTPYNKPRTSKILNKFDFYSIKQNSLGYVNNTSNRSLKYMQEYEQIYESAIKNNSILGYWHYLESIFKTKNSSKIGEKISRILVKNNYLMCVNSIKGYIFSCFINEIGPSGFNQEEFSKLQDLYETDFKFILKKTDNSFIVDLIKQIEEFNSGNLNDKLKKYYKKQILSLYEYRNHYIHTGRKNPILEIQLTRSIPRLIQTFRSIMFKKSSECPKMNFEGIINSLTA